MFSGLFYLAATLHAIIVCDTHTDEIGFSVQRDLENMKTEARVISNETDLDLNLITFSGKSCNPEVILNQIQTLAVAPDDAVFFYFSGHGHRFK